ncbi:Gfo/Idh/MocA family oxidoreductase [Tardiphaga sp.]|uniref:Gfo/Idh/MocA family protein n=1 Tax=Tardiphaga sp. TaxID=1926292 RepID=UPI00263999C5|nr:Gfo/Idh/MocA family oxidoreductase [Tardiphaga sp.]MDB5616521.1 oxidoreductase [Tardiphaga sp.]
MINAAVIGLGWWGQTIARALAKSDVIKPLLGADPLEGARNKLAAETGIATCASFEEALARSDIQAVILCSPQTEHAAQIEAAARAGKHVFCEKPLCTTGADAERAIAAVRQAGVTLGIGHERRFEPAVIDMKQRFADGEFGQALVFEANFSQDKFLSLPANNWRLSPTENPVGPLSATGIHLVDLSISFLGQPKQVWAHLATRGSHFANGDMLSIMLTFESGASATLTAVLATPFMGRLALLGSKGWMEIRDRTHPEHPTGWDVTRVLRDAAPIVTEYPAHPAVRDNLEAFGRAALGMGVYPVPHHEMLANVRTFEAIQRSAASGRIESI